jgi:hypothetical protein
MFEFVAAHNLDADLVSRSVTGSAGISHSRGRYGRKKKPLIGFARN